MALGFARSRVFAALAAAGSAGARHRVPVGWAAVSTCGLVIALTALSLPPGGVRGPAPGGLRVHLPDAVPALVLVLLAAAALLFLALLRPRDIRRRKKGDDDFEMVFEAPKPSPWLAVVLLALVLVPLAVIAGMLWLGWPAPPHGLGGLAAGGRAALPVVAPHDAGAGARATVDAGAFDVLLAVVAVTAGVAVLALVAWLYLGDRFTWWWAGRIFDDATTPLLDAVAGSLDDLRTEPDARLAIVKCYHRFEQALAASHTPRAPWQTPTEFMRTALERRPLPREAVALLTGLFELSRFSERPLGQTERDVACDCLDEIKTALESRRDAPAAA